jgi:hypothetical protein
MCLEILVTGVSYTIFRTLIPNYKDNKQSSYNVAHYRERQKTAVIIVLGLVLLLFLLFGADFGSYSFIVSTNERLTIKELADSVSTTNEYIILSLIFLYSTLVVTYVYSKYNLGDSEGKYIYITVLMLLPALLMIKGNSRFSIVLPLISWMFILADLYPRGRIKSSVMLGTVALVSIISVTLVKNFGGDIVSTGGFDGADVASTFNAYFSHVFNLAHVINLYELDQSFGRLEIFFNDVLLNLPLLSTFAEENKTSRYIYNVLVYGGNYSQDQIISLSGQGALYFTWYLFFVPLIVTIGIAIYFERLFYMSRKIHYKYVFAFLCCQFSLFLIVSGNSIYPKLITIGVPLIALCFLIEFVSKIKRI